jgi:hypothetical protein
MSFLVYSSILQGIVTYANRNNDMFDNVYSFFEVRPTSLQIYPIGLIRIVKFAVEMCL